MFGLFQKKSSPVITAPLNGQAIPITETPDPVFADKILGDGVAIEPTDGKVYAPADATVVQVAHTLHALGLQTSDGLELLIHIGLDTVKLEGKPFTCHVEVGQQVKKGDLLLEADLAYIKEQGLSTISPVIITNMDDLKSAKFSDGAVAAGETTIISYQI